MRSLRMRFGEGGLDEVGQDARSRRGSRRSRASRRAGRGTRPKKGASGRVGQGDGRSAMTQSVVRVMRQAGPALEEGDRGWSG